MGDDVQVGRMVQDLRISKGLRQDDVAARAGVSRPTVSRLERGLIDGITVGKLRAISRALGMPSIASLGWRSPEIDRLRDRLHASMVEQVGVALKAAGWDLVPEYSFNQYGERGSTDILAWHSASEALLIVETKTRLVDLQGTLSSMDRKRRLVPGAAARDFGWRAKAIGVVLVFPDMSTHRHVVSRHEATFAAALPHRQIEVRRWLTQPDGALRGIWFLPISHGDDIGQRSRRRRASRRRPASHGIPPKGPDQAKPPNSGASQGPDPSGRSRGPQAIDEKHLPLGRM
jgi:transcriptional regulator with XRE-family HTH domain